MENKNLFTKSFRFLARAASSAVFCFVVLRLVQVIFSGEDFYVRSEHCLIPKNIMLFIYAVDALILLFLIFVPTKFWLFGAMSIFYSATVFIDQPQNNMGILIFVVGIQILALTGFFQKKGKLKTISFSVLYILLILSEIRFGKRIFILSLVSKSLFFFTVVLILIFSFHLSLGKLIFTSEKVFDISAFPDLTIRDAEWLRLILKETKYDTIARKYNLSEGTVKNNFRRIFKILNVSDRINFMSVYGGCKIVDGSFKNIKVTEFLKDVFWT